MLTEGDGDADVDGGCDCQCECDCSCDWEWCDCCDCECPPPPPEEAGCWVTAGGHIGDADNNPGAGRADQDSFGGNAMTMSDGSVRGEWQNTTHLGDVFHGFVTEISCYRDDGGGPEVPVAIPNNAVFSGFGTWNHEEGYTFTVHLQDRAEGGHHADTYEIDIFDSGGNLIYSESETIDGGNLQIHPSNAGHP